MSVEIVTQMLIRKPIEVVFEAFINPEITKNFWFTYGSGRLDKNETVIWKWEMYDMSINVTVKNVEAHHSITVAWGDPSTDIIFNFKKVKENACYVTITNKGFEENDLELVNKIIDNTGGFTTVLDGAKAYLEHGINLQLIRDKFLEKLD